MDNQEETLRFFGVRVEGGEGVLLQPQDLPGLPEAGPAPRPIRPGEIMPRLLLDEIQETVELGQGDLPGQLRHQVILGLLADKGDPFLGAAGQSGGLHHHLEKHPGHQGGIQTPPRRRQGIRLLATRSGCRDLLIISGTFQKHPLNVK